MADLRSIGFVVWAINENAPYEPYCAKPFRLYAKEGTALKMASDWKLPAWRGGLTVKEVFVRDND